MEARQRPGVPDATNKTAVPQVVTSEWTFFSPSVYQREEITTIRNNFPIITKDSHICLWDKCIKGEFWLLAVVQA